MVGIMWCFGSALNSFLRNRILKVFLMPLILGQPIKTSRPNFDRTLFSSFVQGLSKIVEVLNSALMTSSFRYHFSAQSRFQRFEKQRM